MKTYYAKNKEKWRKRRNEKRESINAAKRKRYAEDEATKQYYKSRAKQYRIDNPGRRRQVEVRNRYGLTTDQYEQILGSQGDACAICRKVFDKTPHVDHCHNTGTVRGLLCFNCNRAIGHFQDDVVILQNAIIYLSGK